MRYFFVFFSIVFFTVSAWSKYRVKVEGLNQSQLSTLNKIAPGILKKKLALSELDQVIQKLYAAGGFSKVSIEMKKGSALYIVGEAIKTIRSIEISGNDNLRDREILSVIAIKEGSKLDREKVLSAGKRIKELYKDKGYFSATIEAGIELQGNTLAVVNFKVSEGEKSRIVSIVVDSPNKQLNKSLESTLSGYIDEAVNKDELTELENKIDEYLLENRYFQSRVLPREVEYPNNPTEATLTYRIKNVDRYEILIDGIWQISRLEVQRKLNLEEFDRTIGDPIAAINESLRLIYIDQGYAHVKVTNKVVPTKAPFLVRVKFNVSEGKQVLIDQMKVEGRISRDSDYYQEIIEENSLEIIDDGYYHRKGLEKGYENLITELQNQGFLQAKINSVRTEFNEDKSRVNLRVLLDEGPLSVIKGITFRGNTVYSSNDLLNVVGLRKSQPLDAKQIQNAIVKLRKHYYDRGHLEMKLNRGDKDILDYDEERKQAEIIFDIHEGPKIYVKDIILEGNTFTKDYVILNSVTFEKGDLLTPELLDDANTRLNRLGIFNRVVIDMLEKNSKISDRSIVISVSERDPGLIRFGAGINNDYDFTIRGFAGVSYNNLWGSARAASLRVDLSEHVRKLGRPTYKATLGYLEPFILDNLTSGHINFTSVQVIDEFGDGDEATIKESNKIDLSLQRDLTKHLKFTWTVWSLDSIKTFKINVADKDPSIREIVIIGPTLQYDNRDNPFLPTKGMFARIGYDYSSPDLGSSKTVEFQRVTGSFSHYVGLNKSNSVIFAYNIQGGYLENLSNRNNSGVPDDYSFQLGGRSTVRGFDASDPDENIVPEYEYALADIGDPYVTTNSSFALLKTEIRIPLYGNWQAAIFYDAGAVNLNEIDSNTNAEVEQKKPFRQTAGVGIRYNTPFGPLNIEYAQKIDGLNSYTKNGSEKTEDSFRFHLSLGTF